MPLQKDSLRRDGELRNALEHYNRGDHSARPGGWGRYVKGSYCGGRNDKDDVHEHGQGYGSSVSYRNRTHPLELGGPTTKDEWHGHQLVIRAA